MGNFALGQILKRTLIVSVSSKVQNLQNLVKKIVVKFLNAKGKFYAIFCS